MIILYMCWIIYILSWIDPSICKQIFPFRHNPYEYFFRGYMLRITYRYQYGKKFIQIEQLCKKLLYSFDSCCKTKKCMFEIPDFLTGTGGSMHGGTTCYGPWDARGAFSVTNYIFLLNLLCCHINIKPVQLLYALLQYY